MAEIIPRPFSSLKGDYFLGLRGTMKPLLPEQLPKHRGRPTLVLDLDHTLVHGQVKRPGLDEFLDKMAELYEIVIFTAASRELVQEVVDTVDTPVGRIDFRLFGDSCVLSSPGVNHKLLKNLGRDMRKVVIVDDTPSTYKFNEENALPITPFYESTPDADQELLNLIPFLSSIATMDDLRVALCQRKGYATRKEHSSSKVEKTHANGRGKKEGKKERKNGH